MASGTQECYVVLERLPAKYCSNKYVCKEAAAVAPQVRECRVLLERLPAAAGQSYAKQATTKAKPTKPAKQDDDVVELIPSRCLGCVHEAPAPRRRKRLGTQNGGVQVARNGRAGLRQATVRQGAASRQSRFYKEVALEVTQRSAQRRGRARLTRASASTAAPAQEQDEAPAVANLPPARAGTAAGAAAAASAATPEAASPTTSALPAAAAPPTPMATVTLLDAEVGAVPQVMFTVTLLDAEARAPSPSTPSCGADDDAPSAGAAVTTTLSAEVEPPAPVAGLLRLECFTEMIKEMVEEGGEYCDVFTGCERVILRHWLDLPADAAAVYLHILGEAGPYIRAIDAKGYPDAQELFRSLERTGFVSFSVSHCEVADLAKLLRKEELEHVAVAVGLPTKQRAKLSLVRALDRLHAEGGDTAAVVEEKLQAALGGCVRVRRTPRVLVERALLLVSAWLAAPADGDRVRATRRLLLRPSARLLAFPDGAPLPQRAMFSSRQQVDEWELLTRRRRELYLMETALAPSADLVAIAEELLQRYRVHVAIGSLDTGGVGCGAMGSLLAETLSAAAEMLRRTGLVPSLVEEVLVALLEQRQHAQERRADWVVAFAALLQSTGDLEGAAKVLIHELDNEGHDGAHRATLVASARALAKNNKLDGELLQRLKAVAPAPPGPRFRTVSVAATALQGSAPSLKRVYVLQPRGQPKTFVSVEERVMAHFAKAYPLGLDDEGATLEALAVLAMWPAVYDAEVVDAWGSPCQDRPLDWGTQRFWLARQAVFEPLLTLMVANADRVDAFAADLCAARRARSGTPSLVRWDLLEGLDIEGLLTCITVPVFAAICRRIFANFSSHRPGFPDLLLWNPEACESLFVEVKGPRDSLHQSQVEWLSYLRDNSADVVVATVTER